MIIALVVNCSYPLSLHSNILNEKLQENNNEQCVVLQSYDPFGPITRAIRTELYKNKINLLNNLNNNNAKMQNIYMFLYVINASERHITTSVFPDGAEAGYQLILNIQMKLLISGKNYYPINIRVHRSFIRNSLNALSNDIQENNVRELMYQEAAEQLMYYMNL